ncbi:MAG: RNA methyltransferase [Planctomycetes bacterium]|nr:RNA methyltransferase [Planctomycetota bacterium]
MTSRPHRYFAACSLGLEELLITELRDLGAGAIKAQRGGVDFEGDLRVGYAACLWSRVAIRVQEELAARNDIRTDRDLYQFVRTVNWSSIVKPTQTMAVNASIRDAAHTNSMFVAQRVKDAVCDWWRDREDRRPSVDRTRPDVPLKVVWRGREAILYRDLVGPSLHKRGYRPAQVRSPLNEALAAGILRLTGWDPNTALLDPMCGSGTFLIEAAHIAMDRAPGLERGFPFTRWPDFDTGAWNQLVTDARARVRPDIRCSLQGSDRHRGALAIAKKSAAAAGVEGKIIFTHREIQSLRPRVPPRTVVVNPPYGQRLGEGQDLIDAWKGLGDLLRTGCRGATAWVLSGDPEITRHLGLKSTERIPLMNGPIDCRLLRYDMRDA